MNNIDWEALREAAAKAEKEAKENEKSEGDEERRKRISKLAEKIQPDILIPSGSGWTNVRVTKRKEDPYKYRQRIQRYTAHLMALGYKSEDVRKLLVTSFPLLAEDFSHLTSSLYEDMRELDACFFAGAYKATLIMAGSILEAFLLDWLSEIDGKNYFEEPYKVLIQDPDGTSHWEKREQLNEYIEQIKEIERPNWMEPSEKAHFIRKHRNLVHAKVCLKEEVGINKETCEKVISYLRDIVETRLAKRANELGL